MQPSTIEALKYAIRHADGWVIQRLQHDRNSVFPSELIACEADVRVGEKLLSCILKEEVTIHQTQWGWIAERK